MKLKERIRIASCIYGLLLLRCSFDPITVAGGASGTDLSACVVSGSVVDSLGKPVSNAVVHLRRAEFLATDTGMIRTSANGKWIACDTETNASGGFYFEKIDTGSYLIEINYRDSFGILLPCTVTTLDNRTDIPRDTLYPLAVISGRIDVNESGTAQVSVIQVYGMERRVVPDSSGYFTLVLPSGHHNIRFSSESGNFDPMEVSVYVHPHQDRDLGHFHMGGFPPPQQPCGNLECDLAAVRAILDSCGLVTVPLDSVVIVEEGRVTGLMLQYRNISRLPTGLERLANLKTLDLSGNAIANLPPLRGLPNLKRLILRANQFSQFPMYIGKLWNIEALDIANNRLQSLPDSIVALTPIVLLDLAGNKLCSLPPAVAAWADLYDANWRQTQVCP
jgi:hypothetical protein